MNLTMPSITSYIMSRGFWMGRGGQRVFSDNIDIFINSIFSSN